MKVTFVYPAFERHADAHPELRTAVPCNEYLGPPSLGIASVAAATPAGVEVEMVDDRVTPLDVEHHDADLFALSFFTPAATRALELADDLRACGKKVVMGGIFPSMMPEVAAAHSDAVVVGEGEVVWPQVIADAQQGRLQPRYDAPVADLDAIAPPRLDLYLGSERDGHHPDDYPLQFSRGCPLHCDACVLPEYLGNALRFHSTANLVAAMRQLAAAGKLISFTEDTSVFGMQGMRRRFRAFLQTCQELQRDGVPLRFSYIGISMPMILHLDAGFLEQLRGIGIDRFYLVGGFDPITRKAFGPGDPKALARAEATIQRCHDFGIDPYVSFLIGNRDDDVGTVDRMLEFAWRTHIDLAEFAVATPYPGTPIWRAYQKEGRIFDYTWKHYNDANVVFRPHNMTVDELQQGYIDLWQQFYAGRQADLAPREEQRRTIQF